MRPSSFLNITYWHDFCDSLFGHHKDRYDGKHEIGSNTLFINGADDPWLHATLKNSQPLKNQLSLTAECENCGHCMDQVTPRRTDKKEYVDIRWKTIAWFKSILK